MSSASDRSLPLPTLGPPNETNEWLDIWWLDLHHESGDDDPTSSRFQTLLLHLEETLSTDEQERSHRFRHQPSRACFVAGRFALRTLLSEKLAIDPVEIGFDYDAYGKPSLSTDQNQDELQFNLSHSRGTLIIGIARSTSIGVDLEFDRDLKNRKGISARYYHRREREAIAVSPHPERAFLECWTRKEALVKAIGMGIQFPLDSFAVPMGELTEAGSCFDYPLSDPTAPRRAADRQAWVYPLKNSRGAIAAAVTLGRPLTVRQHRFDRFPSI